MNQEVIIVRGNHTLKGDVRVSGAKNSALKLMAASILGQGETILHNVPLISDIELMSEVLARLGATVVREGHTPVSYTHLQPHQRGLPQIGGGRRVRRHHRRLRARQPRAPEGDP